jgi:hypothetical protein
MTVAVDGGGGDCVVSAAAINNDDTMALALALAAMASLTHGGGSYGGRCHQLCSAVDAATTTLSSSLTAAAKMPSPPLPSAITAVDNDYHCRCHSMTAMPSTTAEGRRSPNVNDRGEDNYGASASTAATTVMVAKVTATAMVTRKKETW